MNTTVKSTLLARDLGSLATAGLRTARLRSLLSASGIAIGIAAMIAVAGISQSSQARLLAQLDKLGTNLLTVTPGRTLTNDDAVLPVAAPAMIARIAPIQHCSALEAVSTSVRRNAQIPTEETGGIAVYGIHDDLLVTLQASLARGRFINTANQNYPVVVLGALAAQRLGIDQTHGTSQVWLGNQNFVVVGILQPVPLAPEIDRSALIGEPVAESLLNAPPTPVEIYVRADPSNVGDVSAVLARTANPEHPEQVQVARPSDALAARSATQHAFTSLFLGLGAVALLVGGVGIANVMVIAVLERRGEVGVRRALGATRRHIALQFFAESLLLSLFGGTMGVALGVFMTAGWATTQGWPVHISPLVLSVGLGAAVVIGGIAGLYPAWRAAYLSPTEALRTV